MFEAFLFLAYGEEYLKCSRAPVEEREADRVRYFRVDGAVFAIIKDGAVLCSCGVNGCLHLPMLFMNASGLEILEESADGPGGACGGDCRSGSCSACGGTFGGIAGDSVDKKTRMLIKSLTRANDV